MDVATSLKVANKRKKSDNEETEPKRKPTKTIQEKLLYDNIDTKFTRNDRKAINAIATAESLKKLNFNNIKEISKVWFGRTKIISNNAEEANQMARRNELEEKRYDPKIL